MAGEPIAKPVEPVSEPTIVEQVDEDYGDLA
jgi:hypothetical protein